MAIEFDIQNQQQPEIPMKSTRKQIVVFIENNEDKNVQKTYEGMMRVNSIDDRDFHDDRGIGKLSRHIFINTTNKSTNPVTV